jgi:hypothetical protein
MWHRAVVIFNIGPPFGGFRMAVRPGMFRLDHPAVFTVLEEAVQTAFSTLSRHSPDTWPQLHAAGELTAIPPRFDGREGMIDVTGNPADTSGGELVLRAFLPFSGWPLGGWAVYAAWHRQPDGTWSPFSEKELASVW